MEKKDLYQIIAENIRRFRTGSGLTQKEFGLKLGFTETSASNMIYFYESHKRSPSKKKIQQMAEIFKKSYEDFYIDYNYYKLDEFHHQNLVPFISWASVGEMRYPITESEGPPVAATCPNADCVALQVEGDCMEPEFRDGEIIIINPHADKISGMYAIVKHKNKVLFQKYLEYPIDSLCSDTIILRSLNEKCQDIVIDKNPGANETIVIGRVIQKIKKY
jgi:transcriptional regulator with XRE-family HTH domain